MRSIALIALAALIATPALANKGKSQAGTPEATESSQQTPPDKSERKTCRTFENTVSRLKSERLCLTQEQWKKFEQAQQ
ncbi:MAG TPA: hypothetical protein VH331_17065 [Allosphingosinicella sp.]|nr:hypothetical protein [Allosphingosinicella sp.]